MKKVYAAIGHFKGSENITSVALMANTKKDFSEQLKGNEFVPYVVLTESMVEKLKACDPYIDRWEQIKKLTANYRVWGLVDDYIDQCMDILEAKMKAEKESW